MKSAGYQLAHVSNQFNREHGECPFLFWNSTSQMNPPAPVLINKAHSSMGGIDVSVTSLSCFVQGGTIVCSGDRPETRTTAILRGTKEDAVVGECVEAAASTPMVADIADANVVGDSVAATAATTTTSVALAGQPEAAVHQNNIGLEERGLNTTVDKAVQAHLAKACNDFLPNKSSLGPQAHQVKYGTPHVQKTAQELAVSQAQAAQACKDFFSTPSAPAPKAHTLKVETKPLPRAFGEFTQLPTMRPSSSTPRSSTTDPGRRAPSESWISFRKSSSLSDDLICGHHLLADPKKLKHHKSTLYWLNSCVASLKHFSNEPCRKVWRQADYAYRRAAEISAHVAIWGNTTPSRQSSTEYTIPQCKECWMPGWHSWAVFKCHLIDDLNADARSRRRASIGRMRLRLAQDMAAKQQKIVETCLESLYGHSLYSSLSGSTTPRGSRSG